MKSVIMLQAVLLAIWASAGECTRTFGWFQGTGVSDFQVPVAFNEGEDGFTYAGFADPTGGTDLRVTDGTTPLAYEIENWDPDGTSFVWVRVPSFSKDTVLRFTWGDAEAEPVAGNIWTDMALVAHLAKDAHDSSANAFAGSGTAFLSTDGIAGGAARSDGTMDTKLAVAGIPADKCPDGRAFTVSAWVKIPVGVGAADRYYQKYLTQGRDASNKQSYSLVYNYQGAKLLSLYFDSVTGTSLYSKTTSLSVADDNAWHHVAFVYDGAVFVGYCDGVEKFRVSNTTFGAGEFKGASNYHLLGTSSSPSFDGAAMDEVRVETVARDAVWIRAACETQYSLVSTVEIPVAQGYDRADPVADFPTYVTLDKNTKGVRGNLGLFLSAIRAGTARVYDAATGASLPYQIEYAFDDELSPFGTFWVRMPSFDANSRVRVSIGSLPGALSAGASGGTVWPENARAVWHFEPTFSRTDAASGVKVRTMYTSGKPETTGSAATAEPGPTGPFLAAKIGTQGTIASSWGPAHDPGNPTFPAVAISNVFTLSFWARKDDFANPGQQRYFMQFNGNDSGSMQRAIITGYNGESSNNKLYPYGFGKDGNASAMVTVPDAGWHHYAFVQNGDALKLFRDGLCVSEVTLALNFNISDMSTGNLAVGGTKGATALFPGAVDELRLEDAARSADWIYACYRNQNVYGDEAWKVAAPHFADVTTVSGSVESVEFASRLSCQQASDVRFYYGSSDAGAKADGWEHHVDLGTVEPGAVSAVVTGLGPDVAVFGRFAARNADSDGYVFSALASGRTSQHAAGVIQGARAKLTFAYAGAALKDFPVAVRVPASAGLPADPKALRVVDAAGTSLPYEVERWNPSGETVLWVRLPELAEGTEAWLEWRRSAQGPDLWTGGETWDAAYARVFHLGAAEVDSTAGGLAVQDKAIGTSCEGPVGAALSFDGTQGAYRFPTRASGDFMGGFTVSFWAKIADPDASKGLNKDVYLFVHSNSKGQLAALYNFGAAGDAVSIYPHYFYGDSTYPYQHVAALQKLSPITRPDTDWHQYAWTYDGRTFSCYRDGVPQSSAEYPIPGMVYWFDQTVKNEYGTVIGSSGSKNALVGSLDECRLSRTCRSAAWLKASYDNQKPASTFVTVGPTERCGLLLLVK